VPNGSLSPGLNSNPPTTTTKKTGQTPREQEKKKKKNTPHSKAKKRPARDSAPADGRPIRWKERYKERKNLGSNHSWVNRDPAQGILLQNHGRQKTVGFCKGSPRKVKKQGSKDRGWELKKKKHDPGPTRLKTNTAPGGELREKVQERKDLPKGWCVLICRPAHRVATWAAKPPLTGCSKRAMAVLREERRRWGFGGGGGGSSFA